MGLAYRFRGLVYYCHGGKHGSMQPGNVLGKSREFYVWIFRLLLLPKVLVPSSEWCLETTMKVLTLSGSDTSCCYTFSWVRLGRDFPLKRKNASGIHGDTYNLNLELLGFYAYVQFCIYILYLKCLKSPGLYHNYVSVIISYSHMWCMNTYNSLLLLRTVGLIIKCLRFHC